MAKKTQTTQSKNAYGQRFSQQDLTVANENTIPQPLKTPEYKEGGIAFLSALLRGKRITLAGRKDKDQ